MSKWSNLSTNTISQQLTKLPLMSTNILNDPRIAKLKTIADAIYAANQDADEHQLSWIESWASAVASRPDLQAWLASLDGSVVPSNETYGKLSWLAIAPITPKGELSKMSSATVRSVLTKQNQHLQALVAARQRATGHSFERCWSEVRAERPDLVQSTPSAGFFPTPSD